MKKKKAISANADLILKIVHEAAKGMHEVGLMDDAVLKKFDARCLPQVREFTPAEITNVRKRLNLSQSEFAACFNVTKPTVAQWERGATKPQGPALRLMEVVGRKGLAALA